MSKPRKFYVNHMTIRVLSEEPLDDIDLADLNYEVTEGGSVLHTFEVKSRLVTEACMTAQLLDAGSEPGFFRIGEPED